MAPDLAVLTRVVDAHTAGQNRLRTGFRTGVAAILAGMVGPDFYRPDRQAEAADALVELAAQAGAASGGHTVSYLDAMLAALGVAPARQVEPQGMLRFGVDPREVWSRPFEQYRYQYSLIGDQEDALNAAFQRAFQLAETDLTLAVRDAAVRHGQANTRVTYYRRVVRPELSQSGQVCGMCLVASHNHYRTNELMPIHQGCNCTVAEILGEGDLDPGDSLNQLSLQDVYDAAGSTKKADLQRTRYRIEHNSELGPVMVPVTREKANE